MGKKSYGLPYMGSKQNVIGKIVNHFPNAENFYDLFGGGGAVSHFMAESGKYKSVHYNEILKPVAQCFEEAINGKYNPKVFTPKWITREEFFEKKDVDGYIRTCWSFGNRGVSYIFNKDIERERRSMHQAVVFGEFDEWFVDTFRMKSFSAELDSINKRRLYLRKRIREIYPNCGERHIVNGKSLQQLQHLERLEQLERLERLERQSSMTFSSDDYRSVGIKPDSIVYCDIPYMGTGEYSKDGFNHDEFYKWALSMDFPVFISEYQMTDEFHLVAEIEHRSKLSGTNKGKKVLERLYCNAAAKRLIDGNN